MVLLQQISSQLSGVQNTTSPSSLSTTPFSPSLAVLWINALWFLSLVISIASAFYVMLVQQWVRRYNRMTKDLPSEHVHIRFPLFLGAQKYRLSHAIGLTNVPLHTSMFLFLSGLVIFLFTISHTIATVVAVGIGLFGLAYFVLTILPGIDEFCPYFTPMSDISWYCWHSSLSAATFSLRWIVKSVHVSFVPRNLGDITSRTQMQLFRWLEIIEQSFWRHQQCLKDGLRGSINKRALSSPVSMDIKMLTWLLQRPRMSESNMIRVFLTGIPPKTLVQLMCAPKELGRVDLRRRLSDLFGSCALGTAGPDVDKVEERRSGLVVCLNTVNLVIKAHFVTDSDRASPSPSLLDEIRTEFANMDLMEPLLANSDLGIRLTARSICALFSKYLLNKSQLQEPELLWLEGALGVPAHVLINTVALFAPLESEGSLVLNAKSFIYGVLTPETDLDVLSTEHLGSFAETLQIILETEPHTHFGWNRLEGLLPFLAQRIENDDNEGLGNMVVRKLHEMFPDYLPVRSSALLVGPGPSSYPPVPLPAPAPHHQDLPISYSTFLPPPFL